MLKWASAEHHKRDMRPVPPKSRIRCTCGCKKKASHMGMANGVRLMSGCEFYARRWVKDGSNIFRRNTP